jgi:hypothetical protein
MYIMSALLNSTIFRGMLGFVQVIGIVAIGAAAQQQSQPQRIEVREIAGEGSLDANELPKGFALTSRLSMLGPPRLPTGTLAGSR